jgi:hypothetical protein
MNERHGLKRLEEEGTDCPTNSVNSEVSGKRPVLVLLSGAVFATQSSVSGVLFPAANCVLESTGGDSLSGIERG